ncbi:MAG: type II toxin-antitoxin system HicA family toxin [Planctomycetes bacterium]|nr:type II toxin-antitoxin system HicA family toxin [Planctomycetota bacterium]MBI3847986.1 type II toxin-antitoxin system HicA family toxin [Planctomycetota bacterium]
MPPFGPVKRRDLIAAFRRLGFEGPLPGGRHQFMVRGETVVTIPNPHRGDIGVGLLRVILREAGVTKQEWAKA